MLDINIIREDPAAVKAAMDDLNTADVKPRIDAAVALDTQRRNLLTQVEALKATRNKVSKEIGRSKDDTQRQSRIAEMQQVGDRIDTLDEQIREVQAELNDHLAWIPNLPAP